MTTSLLELGWWGAGFFVAGVVCVVAARTPALWQSTGPVPEAEPTAAELDAWRAQLAADVATSPDLDAALARHGLTDGAR